MKVFQEPDMDSRARVEADGNVILPLLGRVKLGGLTVIEAQEYVQALYNADYLVEPQVTLLVLEFRERNIQVMGQVLRPGMDYNSAWGRPDADYRHQCGRRL